MVVMSLSHEEMWSLKPIKISANMARCLLGQHYFFFAVIQRREITEP